MRFDQYIAPKYRKSIEDAFQTILEKGNEQHRRTARLILDSEMLVQVKPVEVVLASGITGLIDPSATREKIEEERLNLREAFGEIFITIAEETIDTGGQRGCEGTFIHENRHAFDFAQVVESFSYSDVHPLRVFNPTLYELEWAAHVASGEYMILVGLDEYLQEGLDLMIVGRNEAGFFVDADGIRRRLRENYGLTPDGNQGKLASEMLRLAPR